MAEFDHGVKKIAETTGRPLARLAGVEATAWQPAESTVQSVEKLADRVFLAGRGRTRFVVYFEFYTTWVSTAPWDMLAKSSLLSQRERLPTVCIAVILQRKGFRSKGGQLRLEAAGGPTQQLWYREVCLWKLKPEEWWEDEPGLMALYPLCEHGRKPRDAITHAVSVIEAKVPAIPERGTFLTLLGIFGQLGYPQLDARRIIGVDKMKESKFYQEIMQEGELLRQRVDIREVLDARFGAAAVAELSAAIDALEDLDHASRVFRLIVRSPTLEEIRSALSAVGQKT